MAENRLPFQPYNKKLSETTFYLQFHAPSRFHQIEALTETFLDQIVNAKDAMITVVDTPLMTTSNFRLFEQLRNAHGEKRLWLETPAHLFGREEQPDLIGLFGLTVIFGWMAYLYVPNSRSVLYNWEGEIFDFWTAEETTMSEMAKLIDRFTLKMTPTGAPRRIS